MYYWIHYEKRERASLALMAVIKASTAKYVLKSISDAAYEGTGNPPLPCNTGYS